MKEYLAASYDRSAKDYDAAFRSIQYEKFRSLILPYKDFLEGKTVIDIGCGTGLLLDFFSEEGISLNYYGVDISKNMLMIAQEKKPDILIQGDMYNLPVKNETADIVASFTVLNIFPDDEEIVLTGMARILKPGGPMIISVLKKSFNDELINMIVECGFKFEDMKSAGQDIGITCFKTQTGI
jgi:ubiquinone/menaquinone biosynthesis C-methylase UbiE